jgi:pyruvate/2-oxoglutarate/acetoin dehydrogenase E1 component
MWGEDIADPKGGVFGVTRGLSTAFPDRVVNSPLAEASIVGVAGGMAIGGYKPIVEIQFADYGSTVYLALDLARQMESQGHSLEVIDLRTIVPLDEEMIYNSVRKTSRVVIAQEDTLTMGFGAEIAARIAQNCMGFLDAPVIRVAAKDSFVPAAPNLELAVLPSVQDLRDGVEQVLRF